jgi:CBS domain-containing protein
MSNVRQLLSSKRPGIWTIGLQAPVYEALELMAEKDIGAVLVLDQERLEGIFSERDYARKVVLHGKSSRDTTVGELMTQALFYVTPEQTVEECLALMTDKHIRHLPVLEHGRLVGLVSIGDAVKHIIDERELTIQHLENYITGSAVKPSTRA